jgi:hypothetical protein
LESVSASDISVEIADSSSLVVPSVCLVLTPKIGLSSSSIPKELLPQLETEEDLEQILADAGEGDTTDGTTDDDESAISTVTGSTK